MHFRKGFALSMSVFIIALPLTLRGIIATSAAEIADQQVSVNRVLSIKLQTLQNAGLKERPARDSLLAMKNLEEIRLYIDDLSRWTYVERVIAPYETIDEAIDQDSIKILHRVIASYVAKSGATEMDAKTFSGAIEFLLHKKADVDLLNDDGEDALCAFLNIGSSSSRTLGNWEKRQKHYAAAHLEPIVKLFLESGADLKAKDKNGASAFELIVDFAGIDFVAMLLEQGIEINTALSAAIKYNHSELLQYALDKGAVLNTDTEEGKELFLLAAANINDLELFKRLVEVTSDINAMVITPKLQRRNALHHLILGLDQQKTQNEYLDKAIYLLEKGIQVIETDWLSQNQDNSLVVMVLSNSGLTFGKSEILCEKLIENGANVNLIVNMQTPLFVLLYKNFRHDIEPLLMLFIDKGADVNYVFRGSQTPLDLMTPRLNSENETIRNRAKNISVVLKSKGGKTFAELGT